MKYELREIYVMEKGWLTINEILTIEEIREYFNDETITGVHIAKEGEYFGSDYSKDSFNYEFPTEETTLELIKKEAYYEIFQATGIEIDYNDLIIKIDNTYYRNSYAEYTNRVIVFDPKHFSQATKLKDYRHLIEILVHELGHYIHDKFFNNKQFRLPTKDRSKYSTENYFENFAEAFLDLVIPPRKQESPGARISRKPLERNNKMLQLLWSI